MLGMGQIALGTTWAAAYPFTQRTEGGAVICRSVPYGVYDGPTGLGETFVYGKGKLLYSIERYFSIPFLTYGDGRYVVSIDFHVFGTTHDTYILDESGSAIQEVEHGPSPKVIHIYDRGVLLNAVALGDLALDHTKVRTNNSGGWFAWGFSAPEEGATALDERMAKHPAFIDGDRLCLIAADGQLIEIHIPSGDIVGRSVAAETLTKRSDWSASTYKRKYERVKYPDKFFLPPLKDGRSMEMAVCDLLGMKVAEEHGKVDVELYFHTLLINRAGRCELAYVSVTSQEGRAVTTRTQEERILAWLKDQTFDIHSIPRGFNKFKYTNFIFLDRQVE